jgi:hypothetical protein
MVIEGQIVNVMETWPLQLTVRTEVTSFHVQLSDRTTTTRDGVPLDPGALRPSARVRITGSSAAGDSAALVAESIDVLD